MRTQCLFFIFISRIATFHCPVSGQKIKMVYLHHLSDQKYSCPEVYSRTILIIQYDIVRLIQPHILWYICRRQEWKKKFYGNCHFTIQYLVRFFPSRPLAIIEYYTLIAMNNANDAYIDWCYIFFRYRLIAIKKDLLHVYIYICIMVVY